MTIRSRGRRGRNYVGLTFNQAFSEAMRPERISPIIWDLWNEISSTVRLYKMTVSDRDDVAFNQTEPYHHKLGAMLAPLLEAMVDSGKVHQLAELIDAASDDGSTCDEKACWVLRRCLNTDRTRQVEFHSASELADLWHAETNDRYSDKTFERLLKSLNLASRKSVDS